MPDDELAPFLRAAKERGIPDDSIVGMLRQNGWSERRIYRALSEQYAGILGVPVPRRAQAAGNARDAFLYLLNFITLGILDGGPLANLGPSGDALVSRRTFQFVGNRTA